MMTNSKLFREMTTVEAQMEQMDISQPEEEKKISLNQLVGQLADILRENKEDEAKRLLIRHPGLLSFVDDAGRSTVHFAAVGGALSILQFAILNNQADAIQPDEVGWSPLMIASSAGRVEVVRFLLGLAQVDPKQANKNGQTSLHYASSKNHIEIVKLLLEADEDCVNMADKYGATALHRAASQGHEIVVRTLMTQPRIRLDQRDSEGNTALHLAVDENREDVAIMLAQRGANVEMKNREEKTPLELAKTSDMRAKLKRAAGIQ